MRNLITLACTECKQRNYQTNKNKKNDPDRIELNKYCKGFSITTFLSETKVELKKVTWPTKQELIANTIVVIIAVVLCAALIWIIDSIFSMLFRIILQ